MESKTSIVNQRLGAATAWTKNVQEELRVLANAFLITGNEEVSYQLQQAANKLANALDAITLASDEVSDDT